MSIIRTQKGCNHPYFVATTTASSDPNLSWAAKGLHTYLLSKPDNWTINVEHLVNCAPSGKDKVYSMLRELEDNGYLVRVKTKDPETGRFVWDRHLYEVPVPAEQRTSNGRVNGLAKNPGDAPTDIPETRQSSAAHPSADFPEAAEAEVLVSIESISTEKKQQQYTDPDLYRMEPAEREKPAAAENEKSEKTEKPVENQEQSSRLPEVFSPETEIESTESESNIELERDSSNDTDRADEAPTIEPPSYLPASAPTAQPQKTRTSTERQKLSPAGSADEDKRSRYERFRDWMSKMTGRAVPLTDAVLEDVDARLGLRVVAMKIKQTDLSRIRNLGGWIRSMPDWFREEELCQQTRQPSNRPVDKSYPVLDLQLLKMLQYGLEEGVSYA